jgi:hypothetical protein
MIIMYARAYICRYRNYLLLSFHSALLIKHFSEFWTLILLYKATGISRVIFLEFLTFGDLYRENKACDIFVYIEKIHFLYFFRNYNN